MARFVDYGRLINFSRQQVLSTCRGNLDIAAFFDDRSFSLRFYWFRTWTPLSRLVIVHVNGSLVIAQYYGEAPTASE